MSKTKLLKLNSHVNILLSESETTSPSSVAPTTTVSEPGGWSPWATALLYAAGVGLVLAVTAALVGWMLYRRLQRKRANRVFATTAPPQPFHPSQNSTSLTRPVNLNLESPTFETFGKRQKTTRKIMLHEFADRVRRMHKDHDFLFQAEFERLQDVSATLPVNRTSLVAAKEKNIFKNRFVDVLPFNESRVKLEDGDSNYINASYIDGYNRSKEYITTQGPMSDDEHQRNAKRENTVGDFWRMVWQQHVCTIVMLTSCVENYKSKCALYWPPSVNEERQFGDITVTLTVELDQDVCFSRKLKLTRTSSSGVTACRTVTQWQFKNWEDAKGHEPKRLLQFVSMVRNRSLPTSKTDAPLLVHCSAGIGRSGTYIALGCLLQHIRDFDYVDVLNCVHTMRNQRIRMVQTLEQYVLLYDCLDLAAHRKLNDRDQHNLEDGLFEEQATTPSDDGAAHTSAIAPLPVQPSPVKKKKAYEAPNRQKLRQEHWFKEGATLAQ